MRGDIVPKKLDVENLYKEQSKYNLQGINSKKVIKNRESNPKKYYICKADHKNNSYDKQNHKRKNKKNSL